MGRSKQANHKMVVAGFLPMAHEDEKDLVYCPFCYVELAEFDEGDDVA